MFLFKLLKAIVYIPLSICYPTKIVGKKNLPKGGAVMVSNHKSNLDGFLMAIHLKEENYYLAKKELFDNKFEGFVMRNIGGIKIDRSGNDVNAIKQCLKVLKAGRKLVIFPEGTRVHNENNELGRIKSGAAMLAVKTKVPLVPIYINKQPKLFRRIKIYIGQPFRLTEFEEGRFDSERQQQAGVVMAQQMNLLRAQVQQLEQQKGKKKAKKADNPQQTQTTDK